LSVQQKAVAPFFGHVAKNMESESCKTDRAVPYASLMSVLSFPPSAR